MSEITLVAEQLEAARHQAEAPYRIVQGITLEAGLYEHAEQVGEWARLAGERATINASAAQISLDVEQLFERKKPGTFEAALVGAFADTSGYGYPVRPIHEIGDFAGFHIFTDFGGRTIYHPQIDNLYREEALEAGKQIQTMLGATRPIATTVGVHHRQFGTFQGADYETPFGLIRVFESEHRYVQSIDIIKLPADYQLPVYEPREHQLSFIE